MQKNITLLAAVLALASPWAAAQTVWRCGNSYSQQPCPGGTATSQPAAERRRTVAAFTSG